MIWIERQFNDYGLCECMRTHIDGKVVYEVYLDFDGKVVYEAYLDYDEEGNLIRVTSTKDVWYDYYHEDDYYERSSIFDRNRRY